MHPPGQRWKYLGFASLIFAGLVALLVFLYRQYLFHTLLYEHGDMGLNSLSVLRAERWQEIHGAFSRFDLHHPGPALFYLSGWSEELFYWAFHLVPTPYNAQVLGCIILGAGFFAGAVCVAARWVRSPFFLPLILLLGALHYQAVDVRYCFLGTWPPFTMPMLFLALVVAAASVGAGQGDDLPLLVLAGAFAVHNHLPQPLFVGPLFTLGYLGLTLSCFRVARAARTNLAAGLSGTDDPPGFSSPPGRTVPAAPWRQHPRAHVLAAVLLLAFLLPLFADLCLGSESNLRRIINNLPSDPSQHHPWLDCVCYFLRFGAYHPSIPGVLGLFPGHGSGSDIRHFSSTHLRMTFLWLGALLSPLLALAVRRWWKTPAAVGAGDGQAAAISAPGSGISTTATAGNSVPPDGSRRWRFVSWLFACWLLSVGLSLCWAHLLAMEMAYYQLWFSYSIWFVLAMIGSVALSDLLETCSAHTRGPRLWVVAVALLSLAGVSWTFVHGADQHRYLDFSDQASLDQGKSVAAALAAQPHGSRTKILAFPALASGVAGGVAGLLERLGYNSRVAPQWLNEFGPNHAPRDLLAGLPWKPDGSAPFDVWHIVRTAAQPAMVAAGLPLSEGYSLVFTHPEIDPNAGQSIAFTGDQPNYAAFAVVGWTTGLTATPFVWSEGSLGLLCFHPTPVPAGKSVEVVFDCFPMLVPGIRDVQRVNVGMNDNEIGTLHLDTAAPNPLPRVLIPEAVWNEQPLGMLTLRYLDTFSPRELHPHDDPRQFALGTRKITFRTVDTPRAP